MIQPSPAAQPPQATSSPPSGDGTASAPSRGLRILVPLDDSPQAGRAVLHAQALVGAAGGQVMLVRAGSAEAERGTFSLAHYAERLRDGGIAVEWSVVETTDARSTILAAAHAWRPGLIAMATRKWSPADRWLNGSVADAVIRASPVPVVVVPPDEPAAPRLPKRPGRILVPLDGSSFAEQALGFAMRLSSMLGADLVLLRVVDERTPVGLPTQMDPDGPQARAARAYLRRVGTRSRSVLPGRGALTRVETGVPREAILRVAAELDVDAVAMATHGRAGLARAVLGSTTTAVLEHAPVPLLLLGPHALSAPASARLDLGAPVRTAEGERVGEVHRVVLDLGQQAVVGVVVLGLAGSGLETLGRDVLVPIDFADPVEDGGTLVLRLTRLEVAALPDFAYDELLAPPPTWTAYTPVPGPGSADLPAREQRRPGPRQHDVTRGTTARAQDGALGLVDGVELDLRTAELQAVWIKADRPRRQALRIPVDWIEGTEGAGDLSLAGSRAEVAAYVGLDSRARLAARKRARTSTT